MTKPGFEYRVSWLPVVLGGAGWTVFYTFMLEAVFEMTMQQAVIESAALNLLIALSIFISLNSIRYFSPSTDRAIYLISAASVASAIVVVLDRIVMSTFFDSSGLEAFSEQALFFMVGLPFWQMLLLWGWECSGVKSKNKPLGMIERTKPSASPKRLSF